MVCAACGGRVRHFATLSAVRNWPPPAPRPEINPSVPTCQGVSGALAGAAWLAGRRCGKEANVAQSRLPEQQIDDPAAADVRPRPAQVAEDVRVGTAGVFEGIRQ